MAIVDLFGLLKSKYNSASFYAEPEHTQDNKALSWKLILITIFPFILDIVDLFSSTWNFCTNLKINLISDLEFYNALVAYLNLWWFVVVGWYVIKNQNVFIQKNEKLFSSNIAFFMFYIFINKFLIFFIKAIIHFFRDFKSINIDNEMLESLTNAFNIFSIIFTVGVAFNYAVNKSTILNAYYRTFYESGFYNDQGKWIILNGDKKSKEKIKSAILYLSTCFAISVFVTVLMRKISGGLETLITGNNQITSKEGQNQSEITSELKGSSIQDTLQLILQIVVIAPIWEELIYRHIILNINNFSRSSVLLASLIFALVHIRSGETIFTFVSYFGSSLVFTTVYRQNKNILFPMVLHFWHNLLSLIVFLITKK